MRAIVTCGPASAPIDSVRRITNFATGEIGAILSEALALAGAGVVCYRARGATSRPPASPGVEVREFVGNRDLLDALRADAGPGGIDAIFHAAALGDFEVAEVRDAAGNRLHAAKIPSRAGEITLALRPAPKVLPALRGLFPRAVVVGWKYEPAGARDQALRAAASQLAESHTDACVVNGSGFGDGFGLVCASGLSAELPDKPALAAELVARFAASP